ncbi:hypothetical protein [Psychrobacter lutiphocae]|uniref:hypothetical protein n=1 Tax=Psychrobacter lutiphocae TaxID=540500 RepID=UPI000362A479|nr:hypothetical protein [Psychrobacter lutiphocae]
MKNPLAAITATAFMVSLLSACVVSPSSGDSEVIAQPAPIHVPIIIDVKTENIDGIQNSKDQKDKNKLDNADKSIHACTLSAFTHQYRSENTNRGRARLDVKKQCMSQFHEMFCRDQDIKCTEYN